MICIQTEWDVLSTKKRYATVLPHIYAGRSALFTGRKNWNVQTVLTVVHGEVFISIPALSAGSYVPKTDDRIVGEIITDEQPPNTALTITAVSDLRFGSGAGQHIEVTAKC